MQLIRDLLASKKFVASLLGVVVGVVVKLGVPEAQVDELLAVVSPLLVYVGAQGFADLGKEKANVETAFMAEQNAQRAQSGGR
jgi:small basic protein